MKRQYFTPLSSEQIKSLCALANHAYKAARSRGAIDDDLKADDYRKQGQLEATGVDSLKKANQSHFLEIRGKWWTVIGNLEQAFYDFLNAGPQNEARRQMAWRLAGQVSFLAEAMKFRDERDKGITLSDPDAARQAWAYTNALARSKSGSDRLETLTAEQLEQLGFTLNNRANAMRGVGSSQSRNKSQRKKSRTSQEPLETTSREHDGMPHRHVSRPQPTRH